MQVTDVKIFPFDAGVPGSRLLAFAEVTLDECLTLRGIRIFRSERGGLFIGYPARKGRGGEYRDLFLVKDPAFKNRLRDAIVEAYKALT